MREEEGARSALVDDMVRHVCARTRFARHPMDGLEWTDSLSIEIVRGSDIVQIRIRFIPPSFHRNRFVTSSDA